MRKLIHSAKPLLTSAILASVILSCAKEETKLVITPNPTPDNVDNAPPTQNPGTGEKLSTDPICTIPLIFPTSQSADENESMLNDFIEQPAWITGTNRVQPPDLIEPPTMACLFIDTSGAKPKASFRLEYEDRYGRVQYTLKDSSEYDYSQQTSSTSVPPAKRDTAGNVVIYQPSYFVSLAEDNLEIFLMPTWGFITIKGKKEADGFFHAKIQYIKFLNAPTEPYYLNTHNANGTANTADIAKIAKCTGDSGETTLAKIQHPDRAEVVECVRAHRFMRSAYRGPWDASLGIFKSHNEYTGISYDYRVEMVRQYTDERIEALADFQTALGQKPKTLGTIKFKAEQVWSGVAP
ncbi:MAG TPA: hypothetical protein VM901_09970 [Bdellovibrionota bacterium]|nr:hypothetical protein [Bdellovibrionota bacterium]